MDDSETLLVQNFIFCSKVFRGAASQYLALPACPPACLSVLQLAYKDDIHCASLRPCRTGFLLLSVGLHPKSVWYEMKVAYLLLMKKEIPNM
jgi:hypothetical protein